MTKNKCLTYFCEGLTLWYSLHTAESEVTSGKRRRRVFFFFLKRDVLNKFMLYVVVVRSANSREDIARARNNTERHGRKINMIRCI